MKQLFRFCYSLILTVAAVGCGEAAQETPRTVKPQRYAEVHLFVAGVDTPGGARRISLADVNDAQAPADIDFLLGLRSKTFSDSMPCAGEKLTGKIMYAIGDDGVLSDSIVFLVSDSCSWLRHSQEGKTGYYALSQEEQNKLLERFVKRPFDFSELVWLTGDWYQQEEEGEFHEHWDLQQPGDVSFGFKGTGAELKGKDTTFSESLRLHRKGDSLYYEAEVAHNSAPVDFTLRQCFGTTAVFENFAHDFPQRIIYQKRIGLDSTGAYEMLFVRVEGPGKGNAWVGSNFSLRKKQNPL